jgi:hypothetical protein
MAYRLLSPSSLHRRECCPGSYRMEKAAIAKAEANPKAKGEPIDGYVDVAQRGSAIHDCVSQGLKSPKERPAILAKISEEWDVESIEIVRRCWDEAESCWKAFTPEQQKLCTVYIEKELETADVGLDGAKLDFAVIYAGTDLEPPQAVIRDWKSGSGWVPSARYNLQLLCYAACVMKTEREDSQYEIGVFQPAKRETADVWVGHTPDIQAVRERIKRITSACEKADAPCYAGGWCEFCAASDVCHARMQVAVEVAQITDPVAAFLEMQPAQQAMFYERVKDAQTRIHSALSNIDNLILEGKITIPGYGVGPGRSSRTWNISDVQAIGKLRELANAKGINPAEVVEPISVASAEKLLGKKAIDGMVLVSPGKLAVKKVKE